MKSSQAELIQLASLPQIVPTHTCLTCHVCCRFPEQDSFLRPYFTEKEIHRAVAHGIDPARFPDSAGSQIAVVPHPTGDGYLCPAFDPATAHCRIYEARPLDCQIYPLAVMWNADRTQVVLGWDVKCPWLGEAPVMPRGARRFGGERAGTLEAHADRVSQLLEQDETLDALVDHPRLVGPFQDDVVIIRPLPRVTARLTAGPGRHAPALRPLTLADRPRFEQALLPGGMPLAAQAFPSLFIWRDIFTYRWTELAGHFCLFAEYADGLFMPLPPLPLDRADQAGLPLALTRAMALMHERNRGSAVTRIENVPEHLKTELESLGYRLAPKEPDYVYQAAELTALAGDRFKSQRAACNRFEREHRHRYEAYEPRHREECLRLYRQWAGQQAARDLPVEARAMLEDAEAAHRQALSHHAELGLMGRVVLVDGTVRAYTFGFPLGPAVFCVLLEVTDRTVHGLAPFIFREFCREAAGRGCASINTMDDSGLPGLARSKQAYHPARLVPSYVLRGR
jgi:Fe-S-cluster containining protein